METTHNVTRLGGALRRSLAGIAWFLTLLAALPPQAGAQTITTKTLDYGSTVTGATGQYTSLAIVNGNPAIAYFNASDSALMFARNSAVDGSGVWTIISVDIDNNVGAYTSLAVVNGNPAISYYDATNDVVKYVRASDASGTTWGPPVTVGSAGNVTSTTSLAVVNGNPAISYYDGTGADLKYSRASDVNGTSWDAPLTLDSTGDVGAYASMVIVNGNPAVSYRDATNSRLKYVRASDASGTSWGAPAIADSATGAGSHTSLAVVNGNPAISYYDGNNSKKNLKYVRAADATGATWGTPVVADSTINVGTYTSLAIVNGSPAISYYDANSGNLNLKYVRATDVSGAGWGTRVTVASTGDVGTYTSMAIVSGSPAISFYDATKRDLKFVRASNASGTSWAAATTPDSGKTLTGDVGWFPSQAIVNGTPAISYHDHANGDLKYVRANDAGGTSWSTPLTLDSVGDVGWMPSLAVVNGNPAIAYYENELSDLKYVRANDANGTSWGTPVTLLSANSTGAYPSLVIVNGNPAITYYDYTDVAFKYLRANDATGTAWGTPVTLASTDSSGSLASLAIVNGNPAVAYHDGNGSDLKYVRANDVNGTSWGMPVTLDSSGFVGQDPSLVIVNGKPAISYVDNTNDDLRYVRANDVNGTNWGTPLILDSVGEVGWSSSMAIVRGKPVISYWDVTNLDLKYVRANDASGTSWGTPLIVDSVGDVGSVLSSAVLNGNVGIGYYDNTNRSLKWAALVYPLTPEIALEQPAGNVLSDGTGSVAFGLVNVGGSSAAITFTIKNSGTADLTGLTIGKDGINQGDFALSALSGTVIPVGTGIVTFTVTFTPGGSGQRTAAIHIGSNVSGSENPLDVTLTGSGAIANADLSSLLLSVGTLTPGFAAATINYTANVPNAASSISVTPVSASAGTTVKVNGATVASGSASGPIALNVGGNVITTAVTASDTVTVKTYTVNVTRAPSSDADLSNLVLSTGTLTPVFSAENTAYTAGVSFSIENLTLTPTKADPNAAIKVNGVTVNSGTASGAISLSVGANAIATEVTAQDGTTIKTYTTTVTRAPATPGDVDVEYNSPVTGGPSVQAMALQANGKVIIGGNFTAVGGATHTNIARVNSDGTVDTGFTASANGTVTSVAVQADGKLVIAGDFTSVNGSAVSATTGVNRIARLNADGTRDATFNAGLGGANSTIDSVTVQADGKLVLAGAFTSVNGSAVSATTGLNCIARLNADGTLDAAFNAGLGGSNSFVNCLAVQADGKILLGGQFSSMNGSTVSTATGINRVARLNADGTLDTAFNAGLGGANNTVNGMAVQTDGKILLGGLFTSVNGSAVSTATGVNRIARLNADGTLDTTFNAGLGGAANTVNGVAVQADGSVLIGGTFPNLNGTARSAFARLINNTATQGLLTAGGTQAQWQRGGSSPEVSQVTFDLSSDGGGTWNPLGFATRVGTTSNWQLTGLSLPASGLLRARGRTASGLQNGSSGLIESTAVLAADIAVEQPTGTGLIDGTSSVDLGAVTTGSSSAPKTFTIKSTGTTDLASLAVGKDGTNANDFTISALSSSSVPAGGVGATFTVTFTPGGSGPRAAAIHIASNVLNAKNPFDIALTGTGLTIFQQWALDNGVSSDPNLNGANGVSNLLNFAFGMNPNGAGSGLLVFNGTFGAGGTIGANGQPITMLEAIPNGVDFRVLYVRRKDYVNAGLTYTVEFSPANLAPWTESAAVPAVLADNGTYQVVSVPFSPFIGGKKARFFRVRTTLSP